MFPAEGKLADVQTRQSFPRLWFPPSLFWDSSLTPSDILGRFQLIFNGSGTSRRSLATEDDGVYAVNDYHQALNLCTDLSTETETPSDILVFPSSHSILMIIIVMVFKITLSLDLWIFVPISPQRWRQERSWQVQRLRDSRQIAINIIFVIMIIIIIIK